MAKTKINKNTLTRIRKARKYAHIGDAFETSKEMMVLCRDADVLVHESTLTEDSLSVRILYVD